ncbi:MAG: DUF6288 domain-containing protein [Akkermansiaceae bacterium]|nr:DUF6288 domain-containing protein [Akkermansiaceae bacterium]
MTGLTKLYYLGHLVPTLLLTFALPDGLAIAAVSPPDLLIDSTKVDRELTYNLGATGLRGWIYTKPAEYLDSVQGRTTTASRQILVTHVGTKSPADGVVQVNDVILGVGGKLFADDARKSIAMAIQEAEQENHGGILNLTLSRAGKKQEARLKLRVMGTYSATAPFNCPKSKKIFEEACKVLDRKPMSNDWNGAINGLALLSTGNAEYLPKLKKYARQLASSEKTKDMVTWQWGYCDLFLCEYFLATNDKEVLPSINDYTIMLAKGQSMYGTFGHGIAELTKKGELHGSIPPYGPVNAAGLIGNLAIVIGKKCGVTDPEVDAAINRGSNFFSYYVDKGAIPYGEHAPWLYHENNGKNSMAAVMFSLQPTKATEATYYAKMATAGYNNRQYGHTGQGFSYLWGALGANVGGPRALGAFFKEISWHLDLARRCDGSFTYDGNEQYGPGSTEDNTYYGDSSYSGLSPAATHVLTYSLPLKKLCITGKLANPANALSRDDVDKSIAAGRFDLDRKTMTFQQLISAFENWSPVVRSWAAEELAKRPEARTMVNDLVLMAEGKDPHSRQGACETLGHLKAPEALPVLVRLLTHEDRWLRVKAAKALKNMGDFAKPAIPSMLDAMVITAEPLEPVAWEDPIQITQGELAEALFGGLIKKSIENIDRKKLYPAIQAVANNPDGMARATLKATFEKQLTLEDVEALAPDLLTAVETRCPADTMFGNDIRMGAFRALTKYHFKEGIAAGIVFVNTQGGHGSESRTGEIMKEIASYGSAARDAIPDLQKVLANFTRKVGKDNFPPELNKRRISAVENAIKSIESAKDQPEIRTFPVAKTLQVPK